MKKFNYENKQYLEKLNALQVSYYSKYQKKIQEYLPNKDSLFLEVGCGNGSVLSNFKKKGFQKIYGVDISKLFINEAKKKGLDNVYVYDGNKLPFKNEYFDLISSFNVLEHTENPKNFIKKQIQKTKKGGIIILGCPNFLTIIHHANHPQLKGIRRKIINIYTVIMKLLVDKKIRFIKMKPIIRDVFEYDDDAIVVTNLIDIKRFFKKNNCEILYESGFINYDTLAYKIVNLIPIVRYLLPSCFIVARKYE